MTQPLSWREAQGQKQELTRHFSSGNNTKVLSLLFDFQGKCKKKNLKHTHEPTNPENEKSLKELER